MFTNSGDRDSKNIIAGFRNGYFENWGAIEGAWEPNFTSLGCGYWDNGDRKFYDKIRHDIKKLCDVFEAFIAAIYLDFNNKPDNNFKDYLSGPGYQMAEKFLINILEDENTQLDMTTLILQNENYKSKLKQYLNRMYNTVPVYETEEMYINDNSNKTITSNTSYNSNMTNNSNMILLLISIIAL